MACHALLPIGVVDPLASKLVALQCCFWRQDQVPLRQLSDFVPLNQHYLLLHQKATLRLP